MAIVKKKKDQPAAGLKKVSRPTNTEQVDEYMQKLRHPMKDVAAALRQIILKADKKIGEEIFWNAPAFFYTGAMKPFKPKEYKRYIVGINLFKKDCIRLIFLTGAKVNDTSGLLEGDYADGRRLAMFYGMEDVESREKTLQRIIRKWLKLLDK